MGAIETHYKSLNTSVMEKMITFKFTFVVYVAHKVNVFVSDLIRYITSKEHLKFT